MTLRFSALLGFAILLTIPGKTIGQTVGGNQAAPNRSGGGGFDPDQMFNRYTAGKSIWVRAEITDQRQLRMFDRIAQQLGSTNGQITRAQFSMAMQQFRANGGSRRQQSVAGNNQQSPTPGNSRQNETFDEMAERQFKQRDRNGDGYLNSDEVPGSLQAQFSRWDTNRDSLIDLDEFKAYLRARMAERQTLSRQYAYIYVPPPEEDQKPLVYSPTHYPKDLPAWFKQLDVDADGQVGLYEWRRSGKSIEEFQAMDRNEDGFLTVEEVLYEQAIVQKAGTKADPRLVADLSPGKSPGQPWSRSAGAQNPGGNRFQVASGTSQQAGPPAPQSDGRTQNWQRFRQRPVRDTGNTGDVSTRKGRGSSKQGG